MAPIDRPEDQDRAETLDETNLTPDGRDLANFDEVEKVFDATAERSDAALDDATSGRPQPDPEGVEVRRGEDASFTGGDPADSVEDEKDPHVDRQLDKGLKETFPASDPVSINPGAD